jgi:hypothetical protein
MGVATTARADRAATAGTRRVRCGDVVRWQAEAEREAEQKRQHLFGTSVGKLFHFYIGMPSQYIYRYNIGVLYMYSVRTFHGTSKEN